jgi:predicted Rossmann-fold nucleotide-binding protein
MRPIPFLLFGRSFWEKVINWDHLAEAGVIAPQDLDLFTYVDSAEAAMAALSRADPG